MNLYIDMYHTLFLATVLLQLEHLNLRSYKDGMQHGIKKHKYVKPTTKVHKKSIQTNFHPYAEKELEYFNIPSWPQN